MSAISGIFSTTIIVTVMSSSLSAECRLKIWFWR